MTTFSRWCSTAADLRCDIDTEIARYGVLVWPPGEVFDYSNLGYGILGDVVAHVSGESFDAYLRRAIFGPLKIRNCSLELRAPAASLTAAQYDEKTHARSASRVSGHEGASGLHCSARDLLSFGMFQLKERPAIDASLSRQDIDDMHSAQHGTRGQYGLGWWIREQSGIQVISAQGGTSDSYALLELIPAENVVIVVIANSYSRLVSGLERQIVSALLPGLLSDEQRSGPRQGQASPAPAALAGKWSGQILTYQGPVNVALDIDGDGNAECQIGEGHTSALTNVSFKPHHFYGQLRGEPGLPDAPDWPFTIELDLALHRDKLIGAATFGPLQGQDGDQLPHLISLAKSTP